MQKSNIHIFARTVKNYFECNPLSATEMVRESADPGFGDDGGDQ